MLPTAFAIAKHVTRCKPHMVGILTCRKTLSDLTFCNQGNHKHMRKRHHPGTHQILKHCVGTPAPQLQHTRADEDNSHQYYTKLPHRNSNLERNPTVSVVWGNLHHGSLAQSVNLAGKADGKHLDFSLQKCDYGENLKANFISQCLQLTEDLESIQGKECKVSSFHTFQSG